MKRKQLRQLEEHFWLALMRLCLAAAALALVYILAAITWRGLGALSWEMLTQAPKGGFYLGKEGGILNAIAGSICLASGATLLAALIAAPVVLFMHVYVGHRRVVNILRLALDVMWGIPSIVYGAFGFALMVFLGLRASLLAGILTLTLVVVPILARTFDEVVSLAPRELREITLAIGSTRFEFMRVLLRQTLPGLLTAILLAFGRGIGDAASVLFTAGYTDNMPAGLLRPVASLPLAIFFQLSTPFPAVQARAYAAALVLTLIILAVSVLAQLSLRRLGRHVIR
ncbi:MAG: ABC transporter permease subunit [Caldilineaceae bacterium]|nr:ABC transporter permease subunit [Caldilineaceae bacterium]